MLWNTYTQARTHTNTRAHATNPLIENVDAARGCMCDQEWKSSRRCVHVYLKIHGTLFASMLSCLERCFCVFVCQILIQYISEDHGVERENVLYSTNILHDDCVYLCLLSLSSYVATVAVAAITSYKFRMFQLFLIFSTVFLSLYRTPICQNTHKHSFIPRSAHFNPFRCKTILLIPLHILSPSTNSRCVRVSLVHRVQCHFAFGIWQA